MEKYSCCFSGHRKLEREETESLKKALLPVILELVQRGIYCFYAGGALGFDMLAAEAVQQAKRYDPRIRLILVLPCKNQEKYWNKQACVRYNRIKEAADDVIYTSEVYFSGCMHQRNRYMIDHSTCCVCYLVHDSGGTKYTVDYCRKKGKQVINLAAMEEI